MLRITRQTDYGIILMTRLADDPVGVRTAADLAESTRLPLPMVSKVLKGLARSGLLVSHRGANGGFSLARAPEAINVAELIAALEGPIALTDCIAHGPAECGQSGRCPTQGHWQLINAAIHRALEGMTLAQMHRAPAVDHALLPALISIESIDLAPVAARSGGAI